MFIVIHPGRWNESGPMVSESGTTGREEELVDAEICGYEGSLKNLEKRGLLKRVTRVMNKDTEIHPW